MTSLLLFLSVLIAASDAPEVARHEGIDPAVTRLLAELQQAVEDHPQSAEAHGDLAIGHEANGLWEGARAAYAEAHRLDPQNPHWRLHLAVALRQSGDFTAALTELEELAARFPDHAPALERLGHAQLESGDTRSARATFLSLIQVDHRLAAGHIGLGDALLRDGDVELAIRQLEAALRLEPDQRSAHYLLGQAYRAAGRADEARTHLARGQGTTARRLPDDLTERLEAYAVNMTARLDRASELLARGRVDLAIANLQAVERDHPQNITALNNLAIAYMRGRDFDRARAALERALAVDPDKFSTYLNLTALSHRLGHRDEALAWTERAVERAPGVSKVHIARANALLRVGRMPDAISSFEAALAADYREQEPYLALANLELRRGDAESSLNYSRRALGVWPDLLAAHLLTFHANLALDDLEGAQGALDAARALAPENPSLAELERLLEEATE